MRVSLWQQFSSNHSARFTIVGSFDTSTKADSAADELRHILRVIGDWYQLHPELGEQWNSGDLPAPTEPEMQFSHQYGVDWGKTSIDWFRQAQVTTFNELVFLDHSHRETYAQAFPFNAIMAKLGGKVVVEGNVSRLVSERVLFEITTRTPDQATAEKIFGQIESFFTAPPRQTFYHNPRRLSILTPWEFYGRRYSGIDIPDVLRVMHRGGTRFFDIDTPDFAKALVPILKADTVDDERIEKFAEDVSHLADQGLDVFIQPDRIKEYIDTILRNTLYHSHYFAWGKVSRNGLQIQLSGLRFSHMADGFPALMRYLADNGCTDIQYTFQESHGGNHPPASQSASSSTSTILRVLELLIALRPPKLTKRK
jgi:hypothetical protein